MADPDGILEKPVALDPEAAKARTASHNAIRRRTLHRMRTKTTDLDVAPMRLDPRIYSDVDNFDKERQRIFRETPILAALTMEIPNPGDMLVFDALGPSIVITRDKEGQINAFLNMCSHRGAKLVTECDSRTRMTCRFHGWTYDLQGKLIGLPGKEGFEGIDRETLSLVRIPVIEWKGLIFVRATPNGEPIDIADHLGPFADELAHLELDKAKPVNMSRLDCGANWKYTLDTYGESYHFATLHTTTIGALAFSNIMVYDNYGPHCRLGYPREEFMAYADRDESEWPETNYGGLYMIFPNVWINVNSMPNGGQFYGISRIFPGKTVDCSFSLLNTYQPAHSVGAADYDDWLKMHDFLEYAISKEDYVVVETGQDNFQYAPPEYRNTLGRNEIALQHYHRYLASLMSSAETPSSD
jgi:phenylpropionate dioxygenase-like ring-hydroxylating dioxygenase large terminal subunit